MTQIPKKRIFYSFLVIEISNLEFICNLVLVFWFFPIDDTEKIIKA